ncbi:hypothetical protein [Marinivivus vitaminiproducens]|uniref:hypothetical protein n=1 Tax=Marinivivus vitaminiproducens TaxID=3035935 RepID=UPI0027A95EE9|nr:hypothetical protein P4R82_15585 [Geminicoccaceae bacterium SCSIO 64248]
MAPETLVWNTAILPFGVAVLLCFVLGRVLPPRFGDAGVVLALAAAFAATYVALLGVPSWPPANAQARIAWLAVALGPLALVLAALPTGMQARAALPLAVLAALLVVLWTGGARLSLDPDRLLPLLPAAALALVLTVGLARPASNPPWPVVRLAAAAAGLGAVALAGHTASTGQLALALTFGAIGASVLPRQPVPFAWLAGGILLAALMVQLALFSTIGWAVLVLVAAGLWSDVVALHVHRFLERTRTFGWALGLAFTGLVLGGAFLLSGLLDRITG